MKYWKIICFALAFLCFGAGLYFWIKSTMVKNTDKVIFLTPEETQAILNDDADHYYQTFHKVDLKVRKSKNLNDYLAKIANSGCDGVEENKEKVLDCIEKVTNKLSTRRGETIEGIQIGKLLDLEWRVGFTCDNFYEDGLPHTRGNVIILNNQDIQRRNIYEMCQLLIHEKVHIYQKTYKDDVDSFISENFEKVREKEENSNIPANPDVDNFIYKDSDGTVLESTYAKKPKHFRDIAFPKDDHTLEHPYEKIAYTLEKLY